MPLDLVQQPTSQLRRERLIQAGPIVRVQVVLHQQDLLGTWLMYLDHLPQAVGIVLAGTMFTHLDGLCCKTPRNGKMAKAGKSLVSPDTFPEFGNKAHLDVSPTPQWLARHPLVADTLAFVLVVLLGWATWPHRQNGPHLTKQLLARLIKADHG